MRRESYIHLAPTLGVRPCCSIDLRMRMSVQFLKYQLQGNKKQ